MRSAIFFFIAFITLTATSCTTTVGGALFVFGLRDLIGYIFLSLLFAVIISFLGPAEKRQRNFWLWFVLNIVITPLVGLIYLIVRLMRRRTPDRRR